MSTNQKLPNLFEAGSIGKLKLKNRMIMAPMGTRYQSEEGYISDRSIRYYLERARGGVGLIMVEGTAIAPDAPGHPRIDDDSYIPSFKRLVESIHTAGIPAVLQINISRGLKDKTHQVGPSEVLIPGTKVKCRQLSVADISELVEQYGKAAFRAKQVGFDGIEIHGGHGYLLANFLSPLTNKRTDEYGSGILGKAKFAVDLVKVVRQKVGADYPVIFRLMADEKIEGGFTLEDAIIVSNLLQNAGVDALDIVAGSIESDHWITPSMRMPVASNAPLSAAIKKEVKIPVIVPGKINDPYVAENVLAEGKADFVSLGRALIADPHFPRKAMESNVDSICKCIGCLRCREAISIPSLMICTVNPAVGREKEFEIQTVQKRKRVLVVGGGPAGLTAVLVAAQRGHEVTLWEESEKPGGQLNLAGIPPGKDALASYLEYLNRQVERSTVKVELKRKAASDTILAFSPDAVIVATGSNAIIPQIKGGDKRKAVTGRDVLGGKAKTGQNVIVVGGGYVGIEIAEFLADQGKKVTVVEILEDILQDVYSRLRKMYLVNLNEKRVKVYSGIKSQEMTEKGMTITTRDGALVYLDTDTIVLATGSSPDKALSQQLRGKIPELYEIGDCVKARTVLEAVHDGAEVALKI